MLRRLGERVLLTLSADCGEKRNYRLGDLELQFELCEASESWCKVYQKKNTRELVTTSGLELLVVKLFEKKLLHSGEV